MILEVEDYYRLYTGGNEVLHDKTYLHKAHKEPDEVFLKRLNRAHYENFQAKIVNTYVGYLFFNKAQVEGTSDEVDPEAVAREAAFHAFIGGEAYILALDSGLKVYDARQVQPEKGSGVVNIVGSNGKIRIDKDAGTIKGEFTDKSKNFEGAYTEGQLQRVRWNETGASLLRDSAPMNIKLFNLESIIDSLSQMSSVYYIYGPPIGEEDDVEPFSYIEVSANEQTPGILQPQTEIIDGLEKRKEGLIARMGRMVGLQSEFNEEIVVQSGIAKAYQILDTNAIIQSAAYNIASAVNDALAVYAALTRTTAVTIKLEPLLNPEGKNEQVERYIRAAKFVQTDKFVKKMQKEVAKVLLAEETPKELQEILEDIETNGGLNAVQDLFLSNEI